MQTKSSFDGFTPTLLLLLLPLPLPLLLLNSETAQAQSYYNPKFSGPFLEICPPETCWGGYFTTLKFGSLQPMTCEILLEHQTPFSAKGTMKPDPGPTLQDWGSGVWYKAFGISPPKRWALDSQVHQGLQGLVPQCDKIALLEPWVPVIAQLSSAQQPLLTPRGLWWCWLCPTLRLQHLLRPALPARCVLSVDQVLEYVLISSHVCQCARLQRMVGKA